MQQKVPTARRSFEFFAAANTGLAVAGGSLDIVRPCTMHEDNDSM